MAYVQLKLQFYMIQVPRNLNYTKVNIEKVKNSRSSTNLKKKSFITWIKKSKKKLNKCTLVHIWKISWMLVPSENFRLEKSDGFRILSTIFWSSTRMQRLSKIEATFNYFCSTLFHFCLKSTSLNRAVGRFSNPDITK